MRASVSILAVFLATLGVSYESASLSPRIIIDELPACDTADDLRGHVQLPDAEGNVITAYIFIEGLGWVMKPTFAEPCTSFDSGGSFTVDLTTGGAHACDEKATEIALYLLSENDSHCSSYQLWGDLDGRVEPDRKLVVHRPCPASDAPAAPPTEPALGHEWLNKDSGSCHVGPGSNYFTRDNVAPQQDALRLAITYDQDRSGWESAEAILTEKLGYGTYVFTVDTPIDQLDDEAVLGLFTWENHADDYNYREIDFEFNPDIPPEDFGCFDLSGNAQYVVQPITSESDCCDANCYEASQEPSSDCSLCRFVIEYSPATPPRTTHVMTWAPTGVKFTSYFGEYRLVPPDSSEPDFIATWTYLGPNNPPPGAENVRMNFWLANGRPPASEGKVVISHFAYLPLTECSDLVSNDHDLLADYPDDPGCLFPTAPLEDPECNDGYDNDSDGAIDLADPHCDGIASRDTEFGCGTGSQLALLLLPAVWIWRSRETAAAR